MRNLNVYIGENIPEFDIYMANSSMALYSVSGHLSRLAYSYLPDGEAFIISVVVPKNKGIRYTEHEYAKITEIAMQDVAANRWVDGFTIMAENFDNSDDALQNVIEGGSLHIIQSTFQIENVSGSIQKGRECVSRIIALIPFAVEHSQIRILKFLRAFASQFDHLNYNRIADAITSGLEHSCSIHILRYLPHTGLKLYDGDLFRYAVNSGDIRSIKFMKHKIGICVDLERGLMLAGIHGRTRAMQLFKKWGACDYNNALYYATRDAQFEAVRILKKWGATDFKVALAWDINTRAARWEQYAAGELLDSWTG